MKNNHNDSEAWGSYWAEGYKTSFGSSFNEGYEGVIKNLWQNYFNDIEAKSRVLDLCTGNASLLRLAKKLTNINSQIKFTGVDYADIKPQDNFGDNHNVTLKFGINIEKLPFADDSFHHVISNYGFEYSNISKSIYEVARVLKPEGKLILVCHCDDSFLIKNNSQEMAMLEEMFAKDNTLDCLTGLINAIQIRQDFSLTANHAENPQFSKATAEAEKFRASLNGSINQLATNFQQALEQSDFLSFLKFLLNKSTTNKLEILEKYKIDLYNHMLRLRAMIKAALSKQEMANLMDKLNDLGFANITLEEVLDKKNKIAIKITGKKLN